MLYLKNLFKVVALAIFGYFRDHLFFIFLNIYLIHLYSKDKVVIQVWFEVCNETGYPIVIWYGTISHVGKKSSFLNFSRNKSFSMAFF